MGKPKTPPRQQPRKGRGLLPLTEDMQEMGRVRPVKATPFAPKNQAQAAYADAITSQELVFGIGPAGVGKTFVAGTLAAEMLLEGKVKKILVTRPICEAGEQLGFLPGDMKEKCLPYFRPMLEVLERRLGKSQVEYMIKAEKIEFFPLAYMRGGSFDETVMLLDEAQNTTPSQMKLFLTRKGEGSIMVVDGDAMQKDIPGPSGLVDGIRKARGLPGVKVCAFDRGDIVRSGLVQALVERYEVRDEAFEAEIAAVIS